METSSFAYEHALRTMRKNAAFAKRRDGGAMGGAELTDNVEFSAASHIYGRSCGSTVLSCA